MPRGHNSASVRRSSRTRRTTYDTLEEAVMLAPATTNHPAMGIILSEANRRQLGSSPDDSPRICRRSSLRRGLRKFPQASTRIHSSDEEEEMEPPSRKRNRGRPPSARPTRLNVEDEEEILDIRSRVRRVREPRQILSPEDAEVLPSHSEIYSNGLDDSNQSFPVQRVCFLSKAS